MVPEGMVQYLCVRIHLFRAWRWGWKGARPDVRKLAPRIVQEVTSSSISNVVVVADKR